MSTPQHQRLRPRRRTDVQREMLEELLAGLPRHFVAVFTDEECYTTHFSSAADAREFLRSLAEDGVAPEHIAYYHRAAVERMVDEPAAVPA